MTRPTWSLLGGAAYTPSHATDIRERFRKVKAEQDRQRRDREIAEERAADATRELFARTLNREWP